MSDADSDYEDPFDGVVEIDCDEDDVEIVSESDDDDEVEVVLGTNIIEVVSSESDDEVQQVPEPKVKVETKDATAKAHEDMQRRIEKGPPMSHDGKRHDIGFIGKLSVIHDDCIANRQAVASYYGASTITNRQVSEYRKKHDELAKIFTANGFHKQRLCDKALKGSKYKALWQQVYGAIVKAVVADERMSRHRVRQFVKQAAKDHGSSKAPQNAFEFFSWTITGRM